jgi:LuxR family transcriptional regulator
MWKEDQQFAKQEDGIRQSGVSRSTMLMAQLFDDLSLHAPEGFSAGLHIRFASPLVYVRTYPEAWLKLYDERAYALRDPIVFWGLAMTGHTRWSSIRLADPFNIFGQATRHGLSYGLVFSTGPLTSRSIVGLARSDREFTDTEIEEVAPIVARLHEAAEPPTGLTKAQIEALRLLANGDRHAAAAARLGISESALKARLQAARSRLGARTTAEALKKAREYQLL